jgi:hypothetical protein
LLSLFLTLWSLSALYGHSRHAISSSQAPLLGFYPEIARSSVVAVGAISCCDTFIATRRINQSKTGNLLVVFLQPPWRDFECCLRSMMESESWIGNPRIQTHIDHRIQSTKTMIPRICITSEVIRHISKHFRNCFFEEELIFSDGSLSKSTHSRERQSETAVLGRSA